MGGRTDEIWGYAWRFLTPRLRRICRETHPRRAQHPLLRLRWPRNAGSERPTAPRESGLDGERKCPRFPRVLPGGLALCAPLEDKGVDESARHSSSRRVAFRSRGLTLEPACLESGQSPPRPEGAAGRACSATRSAQRCIREIAAIRGA